jgi:hypothetical protein
MTRFSADPDGSDAPFTGIGDPVLVVTDKRRSLVAVAGEREYDEAEQALGSTPARRPSVRRRSVQLGPHHHGERRTDPPEAAMVAHAGVAHALDRRAVRRRLRLSLAVQALRLIGHVRIRMLCDPVRHEPQNRARHQHPVFVPEMSPQAHVHVRHL